MKKRTKAGFKEFVFDVMLNGRFICTLAFEYCPLFPINYE
jgi:hypothetical protein